MATTTASDAAAVTVMATSKAHDHDYYMKLAITHYVLGVFYVLLALMSLTILGRGIYKSVKNKISERRGYTSINGNSSSYTVIPGTESRANHIPTAASVVKKNISFVYLFIADCLLYYLSTYMCMCVWYVYARRPKKSGRKCFMCSWFWGA